MVALSELREQVLTAPSEAPGDQSLAGSAGSNASHPGELLKVPLDR